MARVLLVDDEKIARTMYGDFLGAAGHEVTAVASVFEAKQALSSSHFDAVVTDLLLPEEGGGMEVLRHVKENFASIEVILITALDKVSPAVRAIKSGAAEYLVKPVPPEVLQHAVARALTTRQLLQENASLRQYVSLMETGQRVATTLDREQLLSTAAHAFLQAAGARAALLYSSSAEKGFTFAAAHGLSRDEEAQLRPGIETQLVPTEAPISLASIDQPFTSGWAIPANDEASTLGFAVLLFGDGPHPTPPPSAIYLAKHFGLALKNLGRFARVEDLAYLDDLTGLFNVRYLEVVLEQELKSSTASETPFSLLFLDLDYFKNINDTHGHRVGSRLLMEAGRVLKGCVRDDDVVVRYGGDEYVVLLRRTDSGGALKVAERIRRTFEVHQFLAREGYSVHVTTCIGVASYPEHAQDKDTLLEWADRAMYRGKRSSRNVVYMATTGLAPSPPDRRRTP